MASSSRGLVRPWPLQRGSQGARGARQWEGGLANEVKKEGSWGTEAGFVLGSLNVLTSPFGGVRLR